MRIPKNVLNARLETEDDLDEAVAKIVDPKKNGKTKVKKKYIKKEAKAEEAG